LPSGGTATRGEKRDGVSALRKAGVWLGLIEDDEERGYGYDDRGYDDDYGDDVADPSAVVRARVADRLAHDRLTRRGGRLFAESVFANALRVFDDLVRAAAGDLHLAIVTHRRNRGLGVAIFKNLMTTGTIEELPYMLPLRDAVYESLTQVEWRDGFSDDEIIEAYTWLIQHFDEGDEIFIFGFSRGAYTARSLSGLISKCGVMKLGAPLSIEQLYARYRLYDAPTIRSLQSKELPKDASIEEQWLVKYSRPTRVAFVGVWDTVGSLGDNVMHTLGSIGSSATLPPA